MKIPKLQAALKKAQAAEKSAKTAYQKVVGRATVFSDAWIQAKSKYKAARKELKRMRKEGALTQSAHQAARRCYEQSSALLEKLKRKLKKAQKKSEARRQPKATPAPKAKAKKAKPARAKKTAAPRPKAAPKPTVTVPISAETDSFPQSAAAQG